MLAAPEGRLDDLAVVVDLTVEDIRRVHSEGHEGSKRDTQINHPLLVQTLAQGAELDTDIPLDRHDDGEVDARRAEGVPERQEQERLVVTSCV